MQSLVYFVKQEAGLFRKGTWNVMLDRKTIGMHKSEQEALDMALAEAERGSFLGRTSEVWLFEHGGFVLRKAFVAQKAKAGKGKAGEEDDDPAFLDDPTEDANLYSDATRDNSLI